MLHCTSSKQLGIQFVENNIRWYNYTVLSLSISQCRDIIIFSYMSGHNPAVELNHTYTHNYDIKTYVLD